MDDKSALLNQLRIDRSEPPPRSGWVWIAVGAVIVIGAAIGAWVWMHSSDIPVRLTEPQPVADVGAASAGSILDASGYVVARRQATVASKITGKMVELDIEEGDHVREGQIIARLDDTNVRAALAAARAQLDFAKAGLAETEVNLANARRDYDRQMSLVKGHFVSQAAVDNSQNLHGRLDRPARHSAQQHRGRAAQRRGGRAQSRRTRSCARPSPAS